MKKTNYLSEAIILRVTVKTKIAKINNKYHIIDPVVRETCKKAEI